MSSLKLGTGIFFACLLVTAAGVARAGDPGEPLQIQIEARVVETSQDFSGDLGVRFRAFDADDAAGGSAAPTGEPWVGSRSSFEPFPLADDGRVLSEPSLTTLDSETARIEVGPSAASEILVTPRVRADGSLRIQIELSLPGAGAGAMPPVETRPVRTEVGVPDGGSIVIGGLPREARDDAGGSVPWLTRVPVIGRLFRSDTSEQETRNLLIFVTPRLVGDQGGGRPRWSSPPGRPDGASRERIYRPRIDPDQ